MIRMICFCILSPLYGPLFVQPFCYVVHYITTHSALKYNIHYTLPKYHHFSKRSASYINVYFKCYIMTVKANCCMHLFKKYYLSASITVMSCSALNSNVKHSEWGPSTPVWGTLQLPCRTAANVRIVFCYWVMQLIFSCISFYLWTSYDG